MRAFYKYNFNWDASGSAVAPSRFQFDFYGPLCRIFTSSATQLRVASLIPRQNIATDKNLTKLTMSYSQEAFEDIWNDSEEDIWDNL